MYSMMGDVVRRGTATKALVLKRKDLAGKTGTTNDQRDAWFSGFNGALVATAWVGFDKVRPLGRRETGGRAALPMWIDFMREALKDVPETPLEKPKQLVSVRIDPETGLLARAGDPDAIYETFRPDFVPGRRGLRVPGTHASVGASVQKEAAKVSEQLF
jgi:penicillin-binding protein 1A